MFLVKFLQDLAVNHLDLSSVKEEKAQSLGLRKSMYIHGQLKLQL